MPLPNPWRVHDEAVYALVLLPGRPPLADAPGSAEVPAELITASFDRTARLWELADGTRRRTFFGHQNLLLAVAVSRDRTRLATASQDSTIRVWEMLPDPRGMRVAFDPAVTPDQSARVGGLGVAVSPDGNLLATVGQDDIVRLWNRADGKLLRELPGPSGGETPSQAASPPLRRLTFQRDGSRLYLADEQGRVRVWNVADGKELGVVGAHDGPVVALVAPPDNGQWVTAGRDGAVRAWRFPFPEERNVPVPGGAVLAVAVSPNQQWVATAGSDKQCRIWNAGNGTEIRALAGLTAETRVLRFHPDSGRIAVGGDDRIPRLFDVNTGEATLAFPEQSDGIRALAFSPNGDFLAVGAKNGSLRVYKTGDAAETLALAPHTDAVTGVVFTSDGAQIVSVSADATLHAVPAGGGEGKRLMLGAAAQGVAAARNAGLLAVAAADRRVVLVSAADWSAAGTLIAPPARGDAEPTDDGKPLDVVAAVAISDDASRAASVHGDGRVRIWDVKTARLLQWFEGHGRGTAAVWLAGDGASFVSSGADGILHAQRLDPPRIVAALEQPIELFAMSEDGGTFVAGGKSAELELRNFGSGEVVRTIGTHPQGVAAVAFQNDNQRIASCGRDGRLAVWNLGDGQLRLETMLGAAASQLLFSADRKKLAVVIEKQVHLFDPVPPEPPQPGRAWEAHAVLHLPEAALTAAVFAPDSKVFYASHASTGAWFWPAVDPVSLFNLQGHQGPVYGVAFSRDGKKLISAGSDRTVRFWNVGQNGEQQALPPQGAQVYAVAVAPDGETFVTAGGDKTVRVYAVTDGRELRQLAGPNDAIYTVAIDPSGQRVAAAGVDRRIHLWNLDGTPLRKLVGHKDDVYHVEFGPGGRRLASVGYGGSVKVWDPDADAPLFETRVAGICYYAGFHPDGRSLFVAGHSGALQRIELPDVAADPV